MIFRDQRYSIPLKAWMFLRKREFTPTLYRDRDHAPQDGLGGEIYWVTYHGDHLGAVRSVWTMRDGVTWLADVHNNGTMTEDDTKRPRAFPDRVAAINALLVHHRIEGTYTA